MTGRRTVWDTTQDKLARVFNDFDNIIVAFSGGKDSGVLLNATLDYMREHNIDRKIHVFHLDYEAQYTATTDYVTDTMTTNLDLIVPWRVCLPIAAGSAVSMYSDHWQPWNPDQQDLWVRDLPDHAGVIHAGNIPDDFPAYNGVWDYTFQDQFARWHHRHHRATRTAVLIGIREQESLHRHAAIHRPDKTEMWDGLRWTSRAFKDVYKVYPIHDWVTEDVWVANARYGWTYNTLYDLYQQAGLTIHQMRVASPFIGEGVDNLKLYRIIEPEMWARLVGRVNGANFAAIYGGTQAMAAKDVKLPEGHTWKTYAEFLLTTLPIDIRDRYLKKFQTSVRYWTDSGGALRVETVRELQAAGVDAEYMGKPRNNRTYSTPHEQVRFADYPDDLPDITDFAAVPTYKRMCITILRNDYAAKYMGFGQTKLELEKRHAAIAKYKEIL